MQPAPPPHHVTDCVKMLYMLTVILGPELVSTETRAADSDSGLDEETSTNGDSRHRLTFVTPSLEQSQLLQLAYFKNGVLSVFALDGVIGNFFFFVYSQYFL